MLSPAAIDSWANWLVGIAVDDAVQLRKQEAADSGLALSKLEDRDAEIAEARLCRGESAESLATQHSLPVDRIHQIAFAALAN